MGQLREAQDALIGLGQPIDAQAQAQVLSQVLSAAQRALGGQPLADLAETMMVPVALDGAVLQRLHRLQASAPKGPTLASVA